MVNEIVIAIGLLLLTYIIHKKPHFWGKRRLETILVTVSGILLFSSIVAPMFNLEFKLEDNLINGVFFVIFTSFIADTIYKKERK